MIPRMKQNPRVEVLTETENAGGWVYSVVVHGPDGVQTHAVTMSWRDHDHWCGGATAPSRVLQALLEYALKNEAPALPPKFDAARVRRWLPRVDQELRQTL